jgi:hypothetical protein
MLKSKGQASVPRNAFPPTPPGPEGSNGNGLLRVQWVAGAWLERLTHPDNSRPGEAGCGTRYLPVFTLKAPPVGHWQARASE